MKTYRIVEERSCGIVYTRFTGSLEDCKKWLKDNCSYDEYTNDYYSNVVFCDRSSIYIDDPENVNGNNDPFTKKWLKDNCWHDEDTNDYYSNIVFCDRSSIYIDDTCNDPKNVNGNNDPFTYDIEEDE